MILTAHQPCYLPWLGLFAKIAQADMFVLLDTVQYQPRDYNNRNRIWTSRGPQWLTVPVYTKGHREKPFTDIEINNSLPWQRKHLRSLQQNYHKAKYWTEYNYYLEHYYQEMTWTKLYQLNGQLLTWLLHELNIKVEVLLASDYRFAGTKADLVLDICKQLGATTYLFGAQGISYFTEENRKAFESAGVEVRFQEYKHPQYSQFGGPFVSNLSVLDLLFHHGSQSKDILIGKA